ncbi:MAG: ribonuclease D [Pyrinomonadaceae bacterium]
MNLEYRIAFINDQTRLRKFCEGLGSVSALAIDIETINWWNPQAERVALLQLAYRFNHEVRVAVIDALAQLDPTILRPTLEEHPATKAIHNAVFDAVRLSRHFKISTAPIHDTMLAARRNGEKRYSLKAQVEKHLNLPLDKRAQQSDWSVRPLQPKQLDYAALDAVATLLLYEHQLQRGLQGDYRLRAEVSGEQGALPLVNSLPHLFQDQKRAQGAESSTAGQELSDLSLALLGIITELPSRYYPEQLVVCVGHERVGLAGWIIDRLLGPETDVDESSAQIEIAGLCQRGLVSMTPTRRLEASEEGRSIWHKQKAV